MSRFLNRLLVCACLALSGACSEREQPPVDEAEWADVQPLADDAAVVPAGSAGGVGRIDQSQVANRGTEPSADEDYSALIERLKIMKSVQRGEGETLLTSDSLVFDPERKHVRMDGQVLVQDEYGEMEAGTLIGHFSVSNEVEYIEAGKGVVIRSEGREASATSATYQHETGEVLLSGQAQASENGNRLAGERIQLWLKGSRRMVCEPTALLIVSGGALQKAEDLPDREGDTEIRSDYMDYSEETGQVKCSGNVRVRDPSAAMNCGQLLLKLKENNEIDWIEAESEVIIHSGERKALSDRARYVADAEKFVLEGDPKVMQDRNIMTGERIIFWLNTRRMVCEPNARVLLYPDEEMKAKFLMDLKD